MAAPPRLQVLDTGRHSLGLASAEGVRACDHPDETAHRPGGAVHVPARLRGGATVAALHRAEESEAKGAGIATPAERAALAERAREELARRAAANAGEGAAALRLAQHAGDSLPSVEGVELATA